MKRLVLLRHGQSRWNQENRFTGWFDVELNKKGREEALNAARLMLKEGYTFDIAFTSVLKRAIKTLWLVLEEMNLMWIPVHRSWKLNERHYGALQGLNKAETVEKHGADQVKIWRRSYDISPPPITPDSEFYPGKDPRYSALTKEEIPVTECLKDTINRFLPYWYETIIPKLKEGQQIIIVAHGNSLRGLIKHLDQISDNEIVKLNIPTGIPLIYELKEDLSPIRSFYLGDPDEVKKASQMVADQEKKTK